MRGRYQGAEFGDPRAACKHFVALDNGGRGKFWDVRPLTADELADEQRLDDFYASC